MSPLATTARRASAALVLALATFAGDHAPRAGTVSDRLQATLRGGVTLDWRAGELRATAVGVADRRAPAVSTAQAAARRKAEASGRALLEAALADLPWAGAAPTTLDASATARLLALARPSAAELRPDGSWRVTMALPLEAVRVAAVGARAVDEATDERAGVSAIVLDARKLDLAPVLGLGVTIGTLTWRGPVLWTDAAPVAAQLGPRSVERVATNLAGDTLVGAGELDEPADGALLVVRVRPGGGAS